VFDQSYQGALDTDVALPVTFAVNDEYSIIGWVTALQQMKMGDRWEVYIPSDLAYGDYGSTGIPGFSTLVFDISLAGIITNR
jgi:FKBP-type peptidyl-prolyl cis-trans isomerase FklB